MKLLGDTIGIIYMQYLDIAYRYINILSYDIYISIVYNTIEIS